MFNKTLAFLSVTPHKIVESLLKLSPEQQELIDAVRDNRVEVVSSFLSISAEDTCSVQSLAAAIVAVSRPEGCVLFLCATKQECRAFLKETLQWLKRIVEQKEFGVSFDQYDLNESIVLRVNKQKLVRISALVMDQFSRWLYRPSLILATTNNETEYNTAINIGVPLLKRTQTGTMIVTNLCE